ncbi:MAG: hypothetical protein ACKN9V_09955, partial [Pseudomonadota bacterium]
MNQESTLSPSTTNAGVESDPVALSFDEFCKLLKSQKSLIAVSAAAFAFVALSFHLLFPSYQSRVTLMVNRAQNSPLQALMGKMTGTSILGERNNEYQTKYLLYLESHDFRVAVARRMTEIPAWDSYRKSVTRDTLLGKVIRNLIYSPLKNVPSLDAEIEKIASSLKAGKFKKKGTDNIELTLKASNPTLSVELINFLSEAAVSLITEREITELKDAKIFVDAQLKDAETRIGGLDDAVVNYRKNSKYLTTDSVPEQIMSQIKTLKSDIERAELKIQLNNKLMEELTVELQKERADILSQSKGPVLRPEVIDELHRKLQDLREKRVLFEAQGEKEGSSQIMALDQKISEVTEQIREAIKKQNNPSEETDKRLGERDGLQLKIYSLKRENQYLDKQLETFRKALVQASAPLEKLPEAVQTLIGFNRNTVMEYQLLQEMRKKIMEIEIEKISLKSKILVLEKATIASLPLRYGMVPKLFLGILVGGLLASFLIGVKEIVLVTVKNRTDFQKLEIPVLGTSPHVSLGLTDWLSALPFLKKGQKRTNPI